MTTITIATTTKVVKVETTVPATGAVAAQPLHPQQVRKDNPRICLKSNACESPTMTLCGGSFYLPEFELLPMGRIGIWRYRQRF
jgi:hypothetical protein